MEVTDQQRRLLELCAIQVGKESVDWRTIEQQRQLTFSFAAGP